MSHITIWSRSEDGGDGDDHEILIICIVGIVLAWCGVLLRAFIRGCITKIYRVDDWLFFVSLILFTIFAALSYESAKLGVGKPMQTLDKQTLVSTFKFIYTGEIFYNASTIMVKLSYAFYYIRLLGEPWVSHLGRDTDRWTKKILYGLIVVTIVIGLVFEFIIIFQCYPARYYWTRFEGAHGHCLTPEVIQVGTYTQSALSVVVDFTLAILPVVLIRNAALPRKYQTAIVMVMGLGAFASVSTIVRFQYITRLEPKGDFTKHFAPLVLWSVLEPGIALFASGLAMIKPLISRIGSWHKSHSNFDDSVSTERTMIVEDRNYSQGEKGRIDRSE